MRESGSGEVGLSGVATPGASVGHGEIMARECAGQEFLEVVAKRAMSTAPLEDWDEVIATLKRALQYIIEAMGAASEREGGTHGVYDSLGMAGSALFGWGVEVDETPWREAWLSENPGLDEAYAQLCEIHGYKASAIKEDWSRR